MSDGNKPLRTTQLPTQRVTIVSVKLDGRHLLRPFATFVVDDASGEATSVATFATEAGALQAHDAQVRRRS